MSAAIAVRLVVGVLVVLAVVERLHQFGRRVAQVQRHRLGEVGLRGVGGRAVGDVDGVALRRRRQVDDRLRERGVALGHAHEVHGLLRRDRDRQRLRIGVADVLGREADERAARCRADPRRTRPSAPASRPTRRDRCCASTCAAPRSGCSAPRRSCRRGARGSARGRTTSARSICPPCGDSRRHLEHVERDPRVAVGVARDAGERVRRRPPRDPRRARARVSASARRRIVDHRRRSSAACRT